MNDGEKIELSGMKWDVARLCRGDGGMQRQNEMEWSVDTKLCRERVSREPF